VTTGTMEAGCLRAEHSHDYDVKALVLSGEITLTCAGAPRTYRAGEEFAMAAGLPHAEAVGPAGVEYVFGKRRKG
jgi:quercetin dioxygenase-like cupin family protein